jgi:hypothetical protein
LLPSLARHIRRGSSAAEIAAGKEIFNAQPLPSDTEAPNSAGLPRQGF